MRRPVVGVIPVKPLHAALGRLRGTLSAHERRSLQEAMLADVLRACAQTPQIDGALAVTADPAAAALARAEGARVIPESGPTRDMNAAVRQGLAAAGAGGAGAALVLMADLPLVRPSDLAAMLAATGEGAGAVLAPSRDGTGTNAMLLRPPEALDPQLGPGSLARHRGQAARRWIRLTLCECPGLALDIDTPEDLAALVAAGLPTGATASVCARLGPLGPRRAVGTLP